MTDRNLIDKAREIKGKLYVDVHHRVKYFVDQYPTGSIVTNVITPEALLDKLVVIKAEAYRDQQDKRPAGTGIAYEEFTEDWKKVNSTSAFENCETSAIGRALASMDIGVVDSRASGNEVETAMKQQEAKKNYTANKSSSIGNFAPSANKPGNPLGDFITKEIPTHVDPFRLTERYEAFLSKHTKLSDKQKDWLQKEYEKKLNELTEAN